MQYNILVLLYGRNFIQNDIFQLENQCVNPKNQFIGMVEINLEFTYMKQFLNWNLDVTFLFSIFL